MNIFIQYSNRRDEHLYFISRLKNLCKNKTPCFYLCDHMNMSLEPLMRIQDCEKTIDIFKKLDKLLEYSDKSMDELKKSNLFIILLPVGLSGFIHFGYAMEKMQTMVLCGKELYGDVVCLHNRADYVLTDRNLALSLIEEIIEQN